MVNDREVEKLVGLLSALAEAKDLRPGLFTRSLREAVAEISLLTPDVLARPKISSLMRRIGVSPALIAQRQALVKAQKHLSYRDRWLLGFKEFTEEDSGRDWVSKLYLLLDLADPTPEEVARLLAGNGLNVNEALWQTAKKARTAERGVARSDFAREAAKKKAEVFRAKQIQLQQIYAGGAYENKKACAKANFEKLGLKWRRALEALKGAPAPNPWPARAGRRQRKQSAGKR